MSQIVFFNAKMEIILIFLPIFNKINIMLDIKSILVLKILNKECPNGAYKIIDASDIISSMPSKYKIDSDSLAHILNYLERQDCISIKYDDDNVYCISVMPYGSEICQNCKQKEKVSVKKLPPPLHYVIIFFLCMTASFIAILLAKLIKF